MVNLVDIATGILSQATRQVEVSSQNLANVTTPGYKRRVGFAQVLKQVDSTATWGVTADLAPGKTLNTGSPLDLLLGEGQLFEVRSDKGEVFYTRQGQFQLDGEGRLTTAQGYALQAEGGDLVVKSDRFLVRGDGVVTEDGEAVAKLAVVALANPHNAELGANGLFPADTEVAPVEAASVRQGALEASNVSTGDEMVSMMAALRRAEAGQRVINVYDELLGRALTAFDPASAQ